VKKLLLLSVLILFSCSKGEDYSAQIDKLNSEINSLKSQLNQLNSENISLNSSISSIKSEYDYIVSELENEINSLINQVNTLINQVNYSETEIDELKVKIENTELKISYHIKAAQIIEKIKTLDFYDITPGIINLDNCDWIPLITDNKFNTIVAYHPKTETIIIGDITPARFNIDWKLYDYFFDNKSYGIHYVYQKQVEGMNTTLLNFIRNNFLGAYTVMLPDRGDAWEGSPNYESYNIRYQIFDSNGIKGTSGVESYLRDKIERPDIKSIIFGSGLRWKDGWSWECTNCTNTVFSENEPYFENLLIKNLGASFQVEPPNIAEPNSEFLFYPYTYESNNSCF